MNRKLRLALFFILAVTGAFAQTHRSEFGIQTDNDSYLGQGSDRYYTDGIYFYFRRALAVDNSQAPALQNKVLGFEFGQKIFNPQSGAVPGPDYIDRPFAGYLYAGSTLNFLYNNESNIKLGAQLGVIGPASAARGTQEYVHRNFGFYTPAGWQYQIKNNVVANVSAEYNRLLVRGDIADVSLTSYGNLGTGFIGAGVGPLFRLGRFNQLFNSASTQSTAIANPHTTALTAHEFFLYYKPQLNVVGYDATVQGNIFGKSNDLNSLEITGTPERLMLSNQIGVTYTGKRWIIDAAAIFHTKDVKTMVQAHQWGSVTAFYRFD